MMQASGDDEQGEDETASADTAMHYESHKHDHPHPSPSSSVRLQDDTIPKTQFQDDTTRSAPATAADQLMMVVKTNVWGGITFVLVLALSMCMVNPFSASFKTPLPASNSHNTTTTAIGLSPSLDSNPRAPDTVVVIPMMSMEQEHISPPSTLSPSLPAPTTTPTTTTNDFDDIGMINERLKALERQMSTVLDRLSRQESHIARLERQLWRKGEVGEDDNKRLCPPPAFTSDGPDVDAHFIYPHHQQVQVINRHHVPKKTEGSQNKNNNNDNALVPLQSCTSSMYHDAGRCNVLSHLMTLFSKKSSTSTSSPATVHEESDKKRQKYARKMKKKHVYYDGVLHDMKIHHLSRLYDRLKEAVSSVQRRCDQDLSELKERMRAYKKLAEQMHG